MESQRPVHEIRLGRIKATIWENETENGWWCNVNLTRLYRDGDQWKDSAGFGRDDLPLVAKVADLAHSWIFSYKPDSSGLDNERSTQRIETSDREE